MPTELFESTDATSVEHLRAEANRFANERSDDAAPAAELAVDTHDPNAAPLEDAPRTISAVHTDVVELFPAQEEAVVAAIVADPAGPTGLSEHIASWLEYLHVA